MTSDQLALRQQLRFLNEVVGSVDVSYEANYFQIRPAGAYSICNVADLSFRSRRNTRSGRLQEDAAWLAAPQADKLTTVSNTSKARILKEIAGLSEDDVEVIYGAADSLFTPSVASTARTAVILKYQLPKQYFLYVGESTARKNAGLLVQAFQQVRRAHPNTCLVFAGCSIDEVRQGLPGLDLTGVRAVDYVIRADMPAIYGAATALVYPSREEGFGLPVVEAMSTGQTLRAGLYPLSRRIWRAHAACASSVRSGRSRNGMLTGAWTPGHACTGEGRHLDRKRARSEACRAAPYFHQPLNH